MGATSANRRVSISCLNVCLESLRCESDPAAIGIESSADCERSLPLDGPDVASDLAVDCSLLASFESIVQCVRRDIDAIRPYRCPPLRKPNLGEVRWVAKWHKDWTIQPIGHVVLPAHSIIELNVQDVGWPSFQMDDAFHG